MSAAPDPATRKPSPRRRAVFLGLLDALDHVLDEGVTRATLRHLTYGEILEWERLFTLSEPVVESVRRADDTLDADVGHDPSLTQLVVCAAGVAALARRAGLLDEPDDARSGVAALRALREAVDAAYRYSRRAHDPALQAALDQPAA
jgi:hypothetical protein